jgi:hypothetical protein
MADTDPGTDTDPDTDPDTYQLPTRYGTVAVTFVNMTIYFAE